MSVALLLAVVKAFPSDRALPELIAAIMLANAANDELGGVAFLKIDTLARRCRMSRRQTFRALHALRRMGLLETVGATAGGVRRYRINVQCLGAIPRTFPEPACPAEPAPLKPVGVVIRALAERKAL